MRTRTARATLLAAVLLTGAACAGAVVEDASLLELLPPSVDGMAVTVEGLAFTEAAAYPDFAANVAAAVFPIVGGGTDLASGVVAELRDGVFDEGFFRDWRDSYDEGACAQAGGAAGRAEVQLGGRTVFITSCAESLKVYHAHLAEAGRDLVVSLFSWGENRYGEQLMAGINP